MVDWLARSRGVHQIARWGLRCRREEIFWAAHQFHEIIGALFGVVLMSLLWIAESPTCPLYIVPSALFQPVL